MEIPKAILKEIPTTMEIETTIPMAIQKETPMSMETATTTQMAIQMAILKTKVIATTIPKETQTVTQTAILMATQMKTVIPTMMEIEKKIHFLKQKGSWMRMVIAMVIQMVILTKTGIVTATPKEIQTAIPM